MASPLFVACIVGPMMHYLPGTPKQDFQRTDMSCIGPMSAELLTAQIAHNPKGMTMIAYELHEHRAKLSAEPKELGEIKPGGNPEKGRVRIYWQSADSKGPGEWSSVMPEPMAVGAIDREARQQPPKLVYPQVYDLVKANLP